MVYGEGMTKLAEANSPPCLSVAGFVTTIARPGVPLARTRGLGLDNVGLRARPGDREWLVGNSTARSPIFET